MQLHSIESKLHYCKKNKFTAAFR